MTDTKHDIEQYLTLVGKLIEQTKSLDKDIDRVAGKQTRQDQQIDEVRQMVANFAKRLTRLEVKVNA